MGASLLALAKSIYYILELGYRLVTVPHGTTFLPPGAKPAFICSWITVFHEAQSVREAV